MEELELSQRCKQETILLARSFMSVMRVGYWQSVSDMYERATAEDLLHDGFIKIFEAMDQFTCVEKVL